MGMKPRPRGPLRELERWGLLLLQDARLPSIATVVAGEPVTGSWWSHSRAHAIFHAAEALSDHADVTTAKLVSGKVTFVHRRLWPALVAIGRARAPWQLRGLPRDAQDLLARVDARGAARASGKPASELERRLLVAGQQVHTETGAHALELTTWDVFAERRELPLSRRAPDRAQAELEHALAVMCHAHDAVATLPWSTGAGNRRRGKAGLRRDS